MVEWLYTRDLGRDVGIIWHGGNNNPGRASDIGTLDPNIPLSGQLDLLVIIELDTTVDADKNGSVNVEKSAISSAIDKAKTDSKLGVAIIPKNAATATAKMSVIIPTDSAKAIADAKLSLVVNTPLGDLSFDATALTAIAVAATGNTITIEIKPVTSTLSGEYSNRPVYEITITSNEKQISDFKSGKVEISIPYTLKSGEVAEGIKVAHVADDNTLTAVPSKYNNASKCVVFTVTHFSKYVIAYDASTVWTNPFTDVKSGDWFYDAVKYVSANGLMNGTASASFAPNANLTRAMLVTILYRNEVEPEVTAANSFTDVPAGQWYTNAIIWAAENEIVTGYGDGLFGPNDNITREQVATLLMRYAKYKKLDTSDTADLSGFTDAAQISSWAREALNWANGAGLITGRATTTIVPSGTATRAEIATILMRFLDK